MISLEAFNIIYDKSLLLPEGHKIWDLDTSDFILLGSLKPHPKVYAGWHDKVAFLRYIFCVSITTGKWRVVVFSHDPLE